jgi:4-cresol dehydrogenase (hydroxylating) flavoprotein subunit
LTSTWEGHGHSCVARALEEWVALLGAEWVETDDYALDSAALATFKTSNRPLAIIHPANVVQVSRSIEIAARHRTPLYPISRGKNWGYGSRVAHVDGSVLLDLGRLNRIRDFDERYGYVTVEPGVTLDRLKQFLHEQKSKRSLSHPGALGTVSLVGNLLERGFGVFSAGPDENRYASFCDLEVVTGTGQLLHTGMRRFGEVPTAALDSWGIGPNLTGLFVQSNLGVVTAATLWLSPVAPFCEHFIVSADGDALPKLLDTLREIRHIGSPKTRFYVQNRYRYASLTSSYPWNLTGGRTPLSKEEIWGFTPSMPKDWTCVGVLNSASREQRRAERHYTARSLRRVGLKPRHLNAGSAAWLRRLWRPLQIVTGVDFREVVDAFYEGSRVREYNYDFARRQVLWRKREHSGGEVDPDADRCGIYWYVPLLPWDGQTIDRMAQSSEDICLSAGFEPNVAIRFPSDRTAAVVCSILYDRDVVGEDDRARRCYERLVENGKARGHLPYRLGVQGMHLLPPSEPAYRDVIRRLKQALDPSDVIAPGRYDLRD